MSQQQAELSHFDAAKSIVEALKGLDKPSQTLAMRFASETLGLQPSGTSPMPVVQGAVATLPAQQSDPRGATHSTDIRQFAAAKAPKSDQQFAAVVAYFYRFEAPEADRKEVINADALREAARLAHRRQSKNWAGTLNNARQAGYLDAAGSGTFQINSVGENLVTMGLPGDGSEGPPKKRVNKRNAKTKVRTMKKGLKKKAGTKKTAKSDG